jgi:transcriptional regulator with XRE-family HTH domain
MALISPNGKERTALEQERISRFIQALNQAMVQGGLSQRKLASAIGVESGTFTKYLRGNVDPHKVGTAIQAALAKQLGVTLDALVAFYDEGLYLSGVDVDQVESWIRSEAGREDLASLLEALQAAGRRWCSPDDPDPRTPALAPYEWPAQVADQSGLDPAILDRLGIRADRLDDLIERGVIDDDLVEGFALLLKTNSAAVRKAFEARVPLG